MQPTSLCRLSLVDVLTTCCPFNVSDPVVLSDTAGISDLTHQSMHYTMQEDNVSFLKIINTTLSRSRSFLKKKKNKVK